jgi:hypothetical protein
LHRPALAAIASNSPAAPHRHPALLPLTPPLRMLVQTFPNAPPTGHEEWTGEDARRERTERPDAKNASPRQALHRGAVCGAGHRGACCSSRRWASSTRSSPGTLSAPGGSWGGSG